MFPITSIFPSSFMYYVIIFTSSPLPLPYLSPSSPLLMRSCYGLWQTSHFKGSRHTAMH